MSFCACFESYFISRIHQQNWGAAWLKRLESIFAQDNYTFSFVVRLPADTYST